MKPTDTIAIRRPSRELPSLSLPRLPDFLHTALALSVFLACSIAGIVGAFLVIDAVVQVLDEESLLLVVVLLGGLALVLAVPTIAKEILSWLFSRIDY